MWEQAPMLLSRHSDGWCRVNASKIAIVIKKTPPPPLTISLYSSPETSGIFSSASILISFLLFNNLLFESPRPTVLLLKWSIVAV